MKLNENCLDGIWCPLCGSTGPFDIRGSGWMTVCDDGVHRIEEVDWEDDSRCICRDCHHQGVVSDFQAPRAHGAADRKTWEPGDEIWIWPYVDMDEARGVQACIVDEDCPSCARKSLVRWQDDYKHEYESCLNGCCSQLSRFMGPIA